MLAVFTSDPNLMRCELARLREQVSLLDEPVSNAVGLGSYAQDEVLLQRYGSDVGLPPLDELWSGTESEAFLYRAQRLPVGLSLDDNTQPFRFRRWLFAHFGAVNGFEQIRSKVLSSIPEFLQRQIRGDTDSEVAFALFLKALRDTGRTEDPKLEGAVAAQLLAKTVRALEQFSSEAGATGKPTLNFAATNGRMLIATRSGPQPLHYALLEGSERCERCGLDAGAAESALLVREHRMRRTVAITTHARGSGWIELSDRTALAVGRDLSIQTFPI